MAENKPELIKILSQNVTAKLLTRAVAKVPLLGTGVAGFFFGKILDVVVSKVIEELETVRAKMLIDQQVNSEVEAVQDAQEGINELGEGATNEEIQQADKKAIDSYRDLFNA